LLFLTGKLFGLRKGEELRNVHLFNFNFESIEEFNGMRIMYCENQFKIKQPGLSGSSKIL
jgi:hypothetical protein